MFKRDKMGIPEHYFAGRWILDLGKFSIRLHHWTGSDDSEAVHDHASWFWTFVLWGGYDDRLQDGSRDRLRIGSFRFRPAEHRHTVENKAKNTWTFCIFGKPSRRWSFWTLNGKRLKRDKYFAEIGHHTSDPAVRIRMKPDGTRI